MKSLENCIHDLIEFDFDNGLMIWKPRDVKFFNDGIRKNNALAIWNTRYSGKFAFNSLNAVGYLEGTLLGKRYLAHRILWLGYYGNWPINCDHVNRIRTDNRISNLRDVSKADNNKNIGKRVSNKSGHTGVCVHKDHWRAYITIENKQKHLGCFQSKEEAFKVRRAAEIEHGFVGDII